VDSEIAHSSAYAEVLAKYQIYFTIEEFTNFWTRQGKKLKDYLVHIGREDLLHLEEKMMEEKQQIFHSTFEEKSQLMPGALELLRSLKNDFKLGLETSGAEEIAVKLLQHFNMQSFFDGIVTRDTKFDETQYGQKKLKSSRLKYLADILSIGSESCVMVGDAEKDIRGGKELGMKTIAVPNQYTKDNNFSSADLVVKNLSEINKNLIEGLFKQNAN
jgi:HAD superfamily hydrolase (TIGR01549 family)